MISHRRFGGGGLSFLAGFWRGALLLLSTALTASAVTHTWNGTAGYWSDDAKWTNGLPVAGGDVVIAGGTVTLASASADLSSVVMRGGMLVFSNLDACVRSVEVAITNGTVTHVVNSATTTNLDGTWAVDGRVYFACSNFTLLAPGKIDTDAKGYRSVNTWTKGYGPSGGGPGDSGTAKGAGGGGHGSAGVAGSSGAGGVANDSATEPIYPGSAGGSAAKLGGFGGGLVRIEATNSVTISGTIMANGGNAVLNTGRGGGGAGGGVTIGCRVLAGTNGLISANAGERADNGGPGGSGRIAIRFDPVAQAAAPKPRIALSVKRSTTFQTTSLYYSDIGSLSITDISLFDGSWMPHTGNLVCPAFTNWTVDVLHITNGWIRFPNLASVFPLTVSNALTISGNNGILQIYKPDLRCGSLSLTNGASLYVYSQATNATVGDYGALVSVENDMIVGTNCWVYPASSSTNGGSPLFRMVNLHVAANGGFNADGLGYLRGAHNGVSYSAAYGPGRGPANIYGGGGGGYGGRGGSVLNGSGGVTNGVPLQPLSPGSGGGGQNDNNSAGGSGGGLVRIEASGSVTLDGKLTANGQTGGAYGGGGSGGGIFVKCNSFAGAGTGRLWAEGGNKGQTSDGAGGGGRIAVWYGAWNSGDIPPERVVETNRPAAFLGSESVICGPVSYTNDAGNGTVRYVEVLALKGSLFLFR